MCRLLIRWSMYTGWGKSRANTFSLWGRRGERLYWWGDLKLINSYNIGDGREGWLGLVFLSLHSKTLLGFLCSFILGSPHRIHIKWRLSNTFNLFSKNKLTPWEDPDEGQLIWKLKSTLQHYLTELLPWANHQRMAGQRNWHSKGLMLASSGNTLGFPDSSVGKESTCHAEHRRCRFNLGP